MPDLIKRKYFEFEEISSTNDLAARLVEKYKFPLVVTALRQTAGRGRRGRSWISQEGNLFTSLVFEAELKDLGQLVILSGLAVWRTIKFFAPNADVQIKWPNDVMINGAKISGILFERSVDNWWVMGVGINIVSAPEKGTMYPTCSLKSLGANVSRTDVLENLLAQFDDLYEQWRRCGFSEIKKSWLDKAYKQGKKVTVKQDDKSKEGILLEIDDNGGLILQTENGTERVLIGDVY